MCMYAMNYAIFFGDIIAQFRGKIKRGEEEINYGLGKLQFSGVFTQAEDNTHLNARVLPHPLRGSPLPEGASYLAPRKSVTR